MKRRLTLDLVFFCAVVLATGTAQAQSMNYLSASVDAGAKGVAATGSSRGLQRLVVVTGGRADALVLTRLFLHGEGKATVYATGSDSVFSSRNVFGTRISDGGIAGTVTLGEGRNYFWIDGSTVDSFVLSRPHYRQVWADEFDADTISTRNWGYEQGFVRNEEAQWYQKENATCANGVLTIEAKREHRPNPGFVAGSKDWRRNREFIEYTASCLCTAGKQQWLYGRFEMRARIDTAIGCWPAWWTLGVSGRWPANGEIDIMEYYRGKLLANIAVADTNQFRARWWSNTFAVRNFPPHWKDSFHVWRMDWDKDGVGLYLDDVLLNYQPQTTLNNRSDTSFYPFRQPHYMLLNLAIGGQNGGDPSGTQFPLKYEVDYVRVLQKAESEPEALLVCRPTTASDQKKTPAKRRAQ